MQRKREESVADDDDDNNDTSTHDMGERVKLFAASFSGDDNDDDDIAEVDGASSPTVDAAATEDHVPASNNNSDQLMNFFRSLIEHASSSSNFGESLDNILRSSSCLANSEHCSGSISSARKAKSLVERWIARPAGLGRKLLIFHVTHRPPSEVFFLLLLSNFIFTE